MRRATALRLSPGGLAILALAVLVAGCGTTQGPRGRLPPPPPGAKSVKAVPSTGKPAGPGFGARMLALFRHGPPAHRGVTYRGDEALPPTETPAAPRGPASVLAAGDSSLSPAQVGNFTLSLWLKCDQYPASTQVFAAVVGKYSALSLAGQEWVFGIKPTGRLCLGGAAGTVPVDLGTYVVPTGRWCLVSVGWQSSGAVTAYVNTQQVAATSLGQPAVSATPLTLGDIYPATGQRAFVGSMDEVRLATGTLTPAGVAALYAAAAATDSDGDGVLDRDDPDDDNDGIPDTWEMAYFGGRLSAAPDADSDGDGLSNLQEYVAGTDPRRADGFRIMSCGARKATATAGATYEVRCQAVSGRLYQLQSTSSLTRPVWQAVGPAVDCASSGVLNVSAPVGSPSTNAYYRLEVRLK